MQEEIRFQRFPTTLADYKSRRFQFFLLKVSEKCIPIVSRLRVLYFGGNRLTEIPAEVGQLNRLQALVLSDNHLESLPSTIAQLKKLKSLLLHNNQLTTLPPHIIALRELMEVIQIFRLID